MYNIIPLILILLSLGIMAIIIVRKFPALANLDVDNIPAEKEAKFKEQIISNRLKRSFIKWGSKFIRLVKPLGNYLALFFNWSNQKLHEMKDDYKSEKVMSDDDLQQKIEQLFSQAEESKKQDDLDGAEKKYIEIIGFDSKNIRAFKELGELYYERKDYEDAKQTFEHILKLGGTSHEAAEPSFKASPAETKSAVNPELISKQQAQIYADLALVNQALENFVAATASLKKALEIEPNNPRFLDSLLEISIMNKDKVLSLDCYKKLSQVNPDNQKLSDFKAQIDEL